MSLSKIIHVPSDPKCDPDPGGMGVLFMKKMKIYSDNIGQIDSETGEKWTNGEILLKSIRVAQHMQDSGITTDDIIVLCSYNTMESCLPLLAALYLGATVASLDPTLPQSDVTYLLNMVKPKMIFSGSESLDIIDTAITELGLSTTIILYDDTKYSKTHILFAKFLTETYKEATFQAKPVENLTDTAIILFSSGTTGYPKGICTTHYGLISHQIALLDNDATVYLCFTTTYWISALAILTMSILNGGTRIICKKFDETNTLKIIQDYKVNYCFMAPIHTYKLSMRNEFKSYNLDHLKTIIIGGGNVGKNQMESLREHLPNTSISICYGMTEVSGCLTVFNSKRDAELMLKNPLSSGRPLQGISYKIVNVETEEIVGPNEIGEVRVKSKGLMNGYFNNPVESKKAWDADGYLKTGDIGYYDEDQCFFVIDRIKDVMKFESWHIVPAELEDILLSHPDIKDCAVIGRPHEIDGEHATGVIVLHKGVNGIEQEILKYYNERIQGMDRKKLRGGIVFIDSIPRTPSGKPRRRELRNYILNQL